MLDNVIWILMCLNDYSSILRGQKFLHILHVSIQVVTAVEQDPLRSSGAIARELVLPQALVLNALHDREELLPY
jgi:hypothetical protein